MLSIHLSLLYINYNRYFVQSISGWFKFIKLVEQPPRYAMCTFAWTHFCDAVLLSTTPLTSKLLICMQGYICEQRIVDNAYSAYFKDGAYSQSAQLGGPFLGFLLPYFVWDFRRA